MKIEVQENGIVMDARMCRRFAYLVNAIESLEVADPHDTMKIKTKCASLFISLWQEAVDEWYEIEKKHKVFSEDECSQDKTNKKGIS